MPHEPVTPFASSPIVARTPSDIIQIHANVATNKKRLKSQNATGANSDTRDVNNGYQKVINALGEKIIELSNFVKNKVLGDYSSSKEGPIREKSKRLVGAVTPEAKII